MPILEVKDVSKHFGGVAALSNVNLAVDEGAAHAVIGPNGAGKTTLLNVMLGVLPADHGEVAFDGASLAGATPHEIAQRGVARVFQTPQIFEELSVVDNVAVAGFARRDGGFKMNALQGPAAARDVYKRAAAALEDVGLEAELRSQAGHLSRGDKRRLELAICLAAEPRLLLLDEPTAGMSRKDTEKTLDLLKRLGERDLTMLVIEHDMHVVFSLADRITVFAEGRPIADGPPGEIRGNAAVKEAYLGAQTTAERE